MTTRITSPVTSQVKHSTFDINKQSYPQTTLFIELDSRKIILEGVVTATDKIGTDADVDYFKEKRIGIYLNISGKVKSTRGPLLSICLNVRFDRITGINIGEAQDFYIVAREAAARFGEWYDTFVETNKLENKLPFSMYDGELISGTVSVNVIGLGGGQKTNLFTLDEFKTDYVTKGKTITVPAPKRMKRVLRQQ